MFRFGASGLRVDQEEVLAFTSSSATIEAVSSDDWTLFLAYEQ